MKKLDAIDKKFLYGSIAVVAGLYVLNKARKKAAKVVGEAINPISDQNIFYRGSNALMGAVVGDFEEGETIGTWLHKKIND